MNNEKEYLAFISYQRKDEEWAEWLQHQLEHYRLPSNIIEEHPELPREIRPLFRDATELAGGVLVKEINEALENSLYLIVICSPNSAKSIWVNKEVQKFIDLGKLDYIIPFIVEGVPYAQTEEECFVPTLVDLKGKEQELLGINISDMGREVASIKVVARMLHLKFDSLWQRYEKEKEEERFKLIETNNRILKNQSRFIAEKVMDLVDAGDSYLARLLALEALPKELDNPERPYVFEAEAAFRKAVGSNSFVLVGHTDRVNAAVFSPDGTRIVSSSDDKTIKVWDVHTGVLIKSLTGHKEDVKRVGFLDDERLVSASSDNTVRIWDVVKGEQLKTFNYDMSFFSKVLFSPDAHHIAIINRNTIEILNVINGKIIELPIRKKEVITSAAFSQDGQQLVAASSHKIRIWDVEDGRLVKTMKNVNPNIRKIAFDENKELIASFSSDNVLCIWETNTARLVRRIKYEILSGLEIVSFSPDFKYMVFSSYSGHMAMYDTLFGRLVGIYNGHNNSIESVVFSPNLKLMASASRDKTIRVWDAETESAGGMRLEMRQPINHVSFSADGKRLVSSAADGMVSVIDTATWSVVRQFGTSGLFSEKTPITCAEFSPDGRVLVTGSDKGKICIWDVDSGELLNTTKRHKGNIISLSFSPDAKMIVSSASDNTLKVWDVATGKEIKELFVGDEARSLCFGDDCSGIMAVLYGGALLKWNFDKEEQIKMLLCSQSTITSATFSRNKEYIATTQLLDHSLKIWSVGSGELVNSFEGHNTPVDSVAFSPDGRLLASVSMDSKVIIWDIEMRKPVVSYDGGTGHPCALSFSPDGRCIVLAKENGSILIWPFLPLQELIDQTRERFKDRPLTPEERRQYYLE